MFQTTNQTRLKVIKKSIFYVKIEESIIMNIWNWKKMRWFPLWTIQVLIMMMRSASGFAILCRVKKWLLKGQSDWIIGYQNTELDKLISGSPCLCFNMSMPFLTIIYTAVVVYQPDGTRTWQMLPCKVPTSVWARQVKISSFGDGYPLVNIRKPMENHHVSWENPLEMAMFNSFLYVYQRVNPHVWYL